MKRIINCKIEGTICFLLSIFVFLYVVYRAAHLGITYDEAWTLKSFVPLGPMHIINYSPCDANNHILNTLLIKLFYFIEPTAIFFSRLPTVLAFILYLYSSYKISEFLSGFSRVTIFILFIINPFLLDFFSLARGYGLGLGFQMTSLYHLLCYVKNKRLRSANYALIFGCIAVLSNFSQLNYWIACLLTLTYITFFICKENQFKFVVYQSSITICLTIIVYEPIRKLIQSHSLYYGGGDNFYADTLVSLTKYTQYSPFITPYTHTALIIFLLILVTGGGMLIVKNINKSGPPLFLENSIFLLIFLAVFASILQHYLLGTLYLIDRTALFYFPLFVLALCFSIHLYANTIRIPVFSFLLFVFGINFTRNANGYKTALWYFDSHTETILTWLSNKGINQHKEVTIDFSWPFQSAVYHFDEKNIYPHIVIVKDSSNRETMNSRADYYIFLSRSLEMVGYDAASQQILHYKKDTVLSFPDEGVYVFGNIK